VAWRCPAGVQKERVIPEDMYVMASGGSILEEPVTKPPPHKPPKCSECGPLFLKVCPDYQSSSWLASRPGKWG